MNSNDHQKKIFRADTENKKGLTKSAQKKLTAACIAVTAIAVILLAAGLSYSVRYVPAEDTLSFEEMENNMKNQMQQEMRTASAYLEKLDGSIAENQKKLDAVNSQLAQRQESLLEVETTQKKLTENASDVTVRVRELEKKTETQINTIRQDMENVHADIRTTLDKVSELISSMEKQNQKTTANHTETMTEVSKVNESVQEVNKSVHTVEEKLSQSYENLKALLKEINSREEKNNEELTRQLTEVESSLKLLLDADMAQITDAFANLTSEFQNQVAQLGALLDGRMNRLDENMSGLDSNMNRLGENMSGLDSHMNRLGENVSGLDSNVNRLGENIMSGLDSNMEKVDSGIGSLNGSLQEIGDHLNGTIGNLGSDLNGTIGNLGTDLNGSIGNLGTDLNGSIGMLNTRLEDLHAGINSSLLKLQQTFAAQLGELNGSGVQNTDALRTYMKELNDALRQDLNQVFTSVSNGKKGLASALLTKGVTAKDNATFAELKDAILNIPQQLVIGVQEIPGTITYHYHYHMDPDGNRAGETATNDRQGGCYTVAVYHSHDDSCYSWSHEHNDRCKYHPVWVDWDGDGYWGKIYDCGNSPENVRGSLICTLPTSDLGPIYYELGCGLLDGQIIGAEIIYDSNAVRNRNAISEKRTLQAVIRQSAVKAEESGKEKIQPVSPEEAEELERKRQEEEKRQEETGQNPPQEDAGEKESETSDDRMETETAENREEEREPVKQDEPKAGQTDIMKQEMSETSETLSETEDEEAAESIVQEELEQTETVSS